MIPRIDVRGCSARKNFTGKLEFSFDADETWLDIPYVEFASPVKAALSYEIFSDDKAEVTGTVTFALKGLCSRCLASAEEEIVFPAEGVFAPSPEDEEYGYANGFVDLREFLRDTVLFALPQRLLCKACAEDESKNE